MKNYRYEFRELIQRAKLNSPQSFPYLQEIEEFLDDVIVIPKHKFKMRYLKFETKKDEKAGVIKMTGTITFGSNSTMHTRLTDDEFSINCLKEETRTNLISDVEYDDEVEE